MIKKRKVKLNEIELAKAMKEGKRKKWKRRKGQNTPIGGEEKRGGE